jgi:hypothetical protein
MNGGITLPNLLTTFCDQRTETSALAVDFLARQVRMSPRQVELSIGENLSVPVLTSANEMRSTVRSQPPSNR